MNKKFSAADLIKCSARQLVYYKDKKERYATYLQEKGVLYQKKVVADEKNKGVVADEMRGCYSYKKGSDEISIFFCIDMIRDGTFYEIKMNNDLDGNPREDYEEWYLQQSILQVAFYKSLLLKMDSDTLYTPKFRLNEGYEKASLKIDKNADYILKFGEIGDYIVAVKDPDKVIEFYQEKIDHIDSYYSASNFDSLYKHKEFDKLKDYLTYKKI